MTSTTNVPFKLAGDLTSRINNRRTPEVARRFHECTISHKAFKTGMEALRHTHGLSGLEGGGMIVEGVPGVGKTTLLNNYVADVYRQLATEPHDAETIWLPVLKERIPGRPTIPRLIEKLLRGVNHVKPRSRNRETMEDRLHTLIEEQGVEMLILDEYQHLLRTDKYADDTLKFLKVFADDHKLALVFAGLPCGAKVLDAHPEIRERLSFDHVILRPFDMANTDNYIDYVKYIKGIESKLTEIGVDCCDLSTEDFLPRLLLATQGKPRLIARLILRMLIAFGNSKSITQSEFERTFSKIPFNSHLKNFNPFNKSSAIESIVTKQHELESLRAKKRLEEIS
jgi:hypothetical protein